MGKFINFSEFMRYLLDDDKLAIQGSKIIRALLEAQSPRISNMSEKNGRQKCQLLQNDPAFSG
jgi:hypothetical protein